MRSTLTKQTATELSAMRHRCEQLEETCGQALRLLSVAKFPGPATDAQIAAWTQARDRVRTRYVLLVAGMEEDTTHGES